ncbi:MAG: hypothetical protein GF390_01365 [Candidatus Pacebacteria bacterium]|nr:hypothetical protein [Candidatus Paceibacterota bacterium]
MAPTIKTGLVQLIYFTWLHNDQALALFIGIMITAVLLFLRPKRITMFFLLGFVFLLARFEYLKHIADPLHAQTLNTVVQEDGHFRARKYLDLFFNDLVPLGLYLVGWGSLLLGVIMSGLQGRKPKD